LRLTGLWSRLLNRSGQLALYSRDDDWCSTLYGQRPVHYDCLRLTAIYGHELRAVGAGRKPVLMLDAQLR
jgi:hypothetical protein